MKTKYLVAVLIAALLTTPVLGFWHPPVEEPPCPYFGVQINGVEAPATDPYIFQEPFDHYCQDVTVEVYILNVEDLYGYEFKLYWNTEYFTLTAWVVDLTWGADTVIVKPELDYDGSPWYLQVATAKAIAIGVTGDFHLATLTFHIDNDPCYLDDTITGVFGLFDMKASNSCSGVIDLCDAMNAYWEFIPAQPAIYMEPADEVNWIVGDKFTLTIWVENVTKMHDFYFCIMWEGKHVLPEDFYTALLCTTEEDVVFNPALFPAELIDTQTLHVVSPPCDTRYISDPIGFVEVGVVFENEYQINVTKDWFVQITFTKCDPWFCGAQPLYEEKETHDWLLETGETDIWFYDAYFSVCCHDGDVITKSMIDIENAHYTFAPIPGDLDGDGHVYIDDIMIEIGYYGTVGWGTWAGYYYDLNKDHIIDIYDIVIVAKNFCRREPNLDP